MRVPTSLLILALICAPLPGQREIRGHFGGGRANLGRALAAAGDLDGDGHADYVIGAPGGLSRIGTVQAFSGRTGQSLWLVTGHLGPDRDFGAALAGGADADKDGVPDILVGAPRADGLSRASGAVFILSGKDGRRISELSGVWQGDAFGSSIAFVGDIDGDGHPEIVVGAWQAPGGNSWGVAYVYSSRTLAALRFHAGPSEVAHLGRHVGGLGDVNADGVADYFVSAPFRYRTSGTGSVIVLSGKDGSTIHELRLDGTSWLGIPAVALGDIDGDGVNDLGVCQNKAASNTVTVFSGKTGAAILDLVSRRLGDDFGSSFCAVGDADRDGMADICVGAPERGDASGYASVHSGRHGAEIYTVQRGTFRGRFGLVSAWLGDVDRNGHDDLALAAPESGDQAGSVYVLDGTRTALVADVPTLSLAAGGTQKLDLDTGLLHAGKLFFLLGSMSGTTPGIRLGRYVLPLVPDAYFMLTLGNPNLPPLTGSLGLLDTTGKGVARFTLPPKSPPAMLFLTLQHAYVVLSPPLAFDFASNPAFVTFLN